MKSNPAPNTNAPGITTDLTPRECLAIRALAPEWTNREIAMCFGISNQNVSRHASGECHCRIDIPDGLADTFDLPEDPEQDSHEDEPVCIRCGETYEPTRDNQQYCSLECSAADRRKRVETTCEGCGETFEVTPHEVDRRKHCSKECRHENHRVTLSCARCGKTFERVKHKAESAKYCSQECQRAAWSQCRSKDPVEKTCKMCYAEFKVQPHRADSARYCSKRCYRRSRSSDPRPATTDYERLVEHCYLRQALSIDATLRVVHNELVGGSEYSRMDIEETTKQLIETPHRLKIRLSNMDPEDLGLSPKGDRR